MCMYTYNVYIYIDRDIYNIYWYVYIYIYNTSPGIASLHPKSCFECFTTNSNASIDILQNGWIPQHVVSQPGSKNSRKQIQEPKHLHTTSPRHLDKSDMNPQKGGATASPPPVPFGYGYGICVSAWVSLCVGVWAFRFVAWILISRLWHSIFRASHFAACQCRHWKWR